MYSKEQVETILNQIKDFGLNAPVEMLRATPEELCKVCNGTGGEEMPTELRNVLSKFLRFAECSVAIHDWQYYKSDGTEKSREIADKNLRANMLDEIIARDVKWCWYCEWKAIRAYVAVRAFGRADWCIAFAKSKTGGK